MTATVVLLIFALGLLALLSSSALWGWLQAREAWRSEAWWASLGWYPRLAVVGLPALLALAAALVLALVLELHRG